MKKFKQLLSVLTVSLLTVITSSCGDSNSRQSNESSNSSTITPSQEQIDQQKQQEQALQEEQRRQEEQRKLEEQRRQYALAITNLLSEDADASKTAYGDYTLQSSKMRMIDYSKCPNDFAAAYIKHIQAWEYAAKIQKALKELRNDDNVKGTLFLSLLSTITGSEATPLKDALEAEKELKRYQNLANEDIKSTWNDIEVLAVNYGGTLPSSQQHSYSTNSTNNEGSAGQFQPGYYIVNASENRKVYFHNAPDASTKRSAYFTTQEQVYVKNMQSGFGYVEFTNTSGQTSYGWVESLYLIKKST